MSEKIIIFDTTLRDGEQSPGASLNLQEKVEIARQLDRLGVDIIEAGFPVSSPVQFEAVERIVDCVEVVVAGLARAVPSDIKADPDLHRYLRHPYNGEIPRFPLWEILTSQAGHRPENGQGSRRLCNQFHRRCGIFR